MNGTKNAIFEQKRTKHYFTKAHNLESRIPLPGTESLCPKDGVSANFTVVCKLKSFKSLQFSCLTYQSWIKHTPSFSRSYSNKNLFSQYKNKIRNKTLLFLQGKSASVRSKECIWHSRLSQNCGSPCSCPSASTVSATVCHFDVNVLQRWNLSIPSVPAGV